MRFGDRGTLPPGELEADLYDPAVDCHCQVCGVQYNGSDSSGGHHTGGRFGGCCQSFRSLGGFDKHMIGPRDSNGQLRCLTPDELTAKGWTLDDTGAWRMPAPQTSPWKKEPA